MKAHSTKFPTPISGGMLHFIDSKKKHRVRVAVPNHLTGHWICVIED